MTKLFDAMTEIVNMPYFRNYQAVSGSVHNVNNHEQAVEDILVKHGFVQATMPKIKGGAKKLRDKWLRGENDKLDSLPENCYISQPTGTHDSPDFIVKEGNKVFCIECKSAKDFTPTYNGGKPKTGYIYIFSSQRANETTVYLSEDVLSEEQNMLLEELVGKLNDTVKEYREKLRADDELNRGFDFYMRSMYIQSGGADKTNYFTHEDRAYCEARVLNKVL